MARTNAGVRRTGTSVAFVLMFAGAVTMVLPFLWMLSTSLKQSNLVFGAPEWIPDPVDWANYAEVWDAAPLATGLLNSVIVTVVVVVLGVFSSTMAAFAFAKLDFPHKRTIFVVLLSTIMIPLVVMILPQFLVFAQIGWTDTLLPLIVSGLLLTNATMIFFLRQYMFGIATELLEAAKLDGAGYLRIYWSIFLPLCKPAIAANVIIVFMTTWNDYLGPLIFTSSPDKSTVQLVIASLNAYHAEQTDYPLIMAASIIAVLPVVILFIAAQKYFVDSFAFSGIKG
ncbi:carbohydrate ABC transporter permease [Microcella indica]|uniref:carbohydrate ABC transporter permease n=1 Tax=Microcella indica TaxID=2750620 RepID=UPI0015CF2615|nr:carbohydrate ABC transporter permease [Microcella indica]